MFLKGIFEFFFIYDLTFPLSLSYKMFVSLRKALPGFQQNSGDFRIAHSNAEKSRQIVSRTW